VRGFMIVGALALLGASAPPTADQIGPAPSFDQAVAAGEAAIKASLVDPDSAKIRWPYNFVGGSLKPLFSKTQYGFYTCGFVNARNRMGGYTGDQWFLIMLRDGQLVSLDIGNADQVSAASATCPGLVKQGTLSPAPSAVASTAVPAPGPLGIRFQPTPYGAMIATVEPGSIAEMAGLRPGEVIESVNGIPIKAMAPADMIAAVAAPTASAFGIIGAGQVKVRP